MPVHKESPLLELLVRMFETINPRARRSWFRSILRARKSSAEDTALLTDYYELGDEPPPGNDKPN